MGEGVLVLPLGRPFRAIRRIFAAFLGPQSVRRCADVQTHAVAECLRRLVGQRQDPLVALKRCASESVLGPASGH